MKQNSPITPSVWPVCAVCLIVTLALSWACLLVYEAATDAEGRWSRLAVFLGVLLVVGLTMQGAFKLLSLRITSTGIGQTVLFEQGRLVSRKSLGWQEISSVESLPGSYRLSNPTCTIEVHTTYFARSSEVSKFIGAHLPKQAVLS